MSMKQGEQPLVVDPEGTVRFRLNPIVRWLLDAGPFSMNMLADLPGVSSEDRQIFAQLIGYSVGCYGELSYVDDAAYDRVQAASDTLTSGEET